MRYRGRSDKGHPADARAAADRAAEMDLSHARDAGDGADGAIEVNGSGEDQVLRARRPDATEKSLRTEMAFARVAPVCGAQDSR